MSEALVLTGYDLSDEGPGRTVNEDATLVREDLGLFAVADGAGGRGRGDVAANLALRTIENYVGSTVRRSHERPDFDDLGTPEQARRLSSAVHQAHRYIQKVIEESPERKGMATTVVAALLAPRTKQVHIAHVGDSRCYRLRHGRLEQLTADHTIATEILERRPETSDEIIANLPRNSVVSALGMDQELRVNVRTLDLQAGDRFLLCTDGLTSFVSSADIWATVREPDQASVVASELLSHALAARSQDNISVLVMDCVERVVDEEVETRRYNEIPAKPPSTPTVELSDAPNSAEFDGPEILAPDYAQAVEDWITDSDYPTSPLPEAEAHVSLGFSAPLIAPLVPLLPLPLEEAASATFAVDENDLELEGETDTSQEELEELELIPSRRGKDQDP